MATTARPPDRARPDAHSGGLAPVDARTTATASRSDEEFRRIVERLSKLSVERGHDAYADVAWDSPDLAVHPDDDRWALWSTDVLARTRWFARQDADTRRALGRWRVATMLRVGWEFENLLQRGLLATAFRLPNESPEFRYIHHEVVEESQHSMMFQELVNRVEPDARGIPQPVRLLTGAVFPINRLFPELFSFFVLGGEEPVDHLQRMALRDDTLHPLVERVVRIHVAEEARHVSYARHRLRRGVPRLGPVRRRLLAAAVPLIMGLMTRLMVHPTPQLVRHFEIPRRELRAAKRHPESRAVLVASAAKVRELCEELGLYGRTARLLWRAVGLAPRAGAASATGA